MSEHLLQKFTRKNRMVGGLQVLEDGNNKEEPSKYNMSPLMKFIAEQVKQAYIAGYNGLNLSTPRKDITETGEVVINATNYAKDKGFLI